jgi:hypothetical protein
MAQYGIHYTPSDFGIMRSRKGFVSTQPFATHHGSVSFTFHDGPERRREAFLNVHSNGQDLTRNISDYMSGSYIDLDYFIRLMCELGIEKIIPRSNWSIHTPPPGALTNHIPNIIIFHHFVGSPPEGLDINQWLQNQEHGHVVDNGWTGGIGYHYIITADGAIFEGRPENVEGAHVRGHNTGTIGISFTGDFSANNSMPTQAALDSATWLVTNIRSRNSITGIFAHSQMEGHAGRGDFASNQKMLDWIGGFSN